MAARHPPQKTRKLVCAACTSALSLGLAAVLLRCCCQTALVLPCVFMCGQAPPRCLLPAAAVPAAMMLLVYLHAQLTSMPKASKRSFAEYDAFCCSRRSAAARRSLASSGVELGVGAAAGPEMPADGKPGGGGTPGAKSANTSRAASAMSVLPYASNTWQEPTAAGAEWRPRAGAGHWSSIVSPKHYCAWQSACGLGIRAFEMRAQPSAAKKGSGHLDE
jgi:hypothetical protein